MNDIREREREPREEDDDAILVDDDETNFPGSDSPHQGLSSIKLTRPAAIKTATTRPAAAAKTATTKSAARPAKPRSLPQQTVLSTINDIQTALPEGTVIKIQVDENGNIKFCVSNTKDRQENEEKAPKKMKSAKERPTSVERNLRMREWMDEEEDEEDEEYEEYEEDDLIPI